MSCPHGNHPDGCERCAEIADHERAYELLFKENATLRAEVERLAAQAAQAPVVQAVRMLTEHEVTLCHSYAVLAQRCDGIGPSFTTLLMREFHKMFTAVNAGRTIPADGKIGSAA